MWAKPGIKGLWYPSIPSVDCTCFKVSSFHGQFFRPSTLIGVTTLQGHSVTRLGEALEQSSGMTLSRTSLVLSGRMRSVQQRKAIPFAA